MTLNINKMGSYINKMGSYINKMGLYINKMDSYINKMGSYINKMDFNTSIMNFVGYNNLSDNSKGICWIGFEYFLSIEIIHFVKFLIFFFI